MSLLVSLAGSRVGEGLVAVSAAEGLLSRVDTDVSLEIPCVSELLPTVLCEENPSTRVDGFQSESQRN